MNARETAQLLGDKYIAHCGQRVSLRRNGSAVKPVICDERVEKLMLDIQTNDIIRLGSDAIDLFLEIELQDS